MARRWCALLETDLLFWIDDCYNSNLPGIGDIDLTSRKPLVEKPYPTCEGARWRCPYNRGDFMGLHSFEESGQDTEIKAFPLQCENELTLERIGRTMTRRQQEPGRVRCRVVTLGNDG